MSKRNRRKRQLENRLLDREYWGMVEYDEMQLERLWQENLAKPVFPEQEKEAQ
jgi:hypothetical protein